MLWPFWKKVQARYTAKMLLQPGQDPDHPLGFFDRTWASRGREYRTLVEPIDIANWCQAFSGRFVNISGYPSPAAMQPELDTSGPA